MHHMGMHIIRDVVFGWLTTRSIVSLYWFDVCPHEVLITTLDH